MDLYHVCPQGYLDSIRETGLRIDSAQGAIKGIWLVERDRLEWAWLHVAKHQGEHVENMLALPVQVPQELLSYRGRKVWVCRENIPAVLIGVPIKHENLICFRI